MTEEENLDFIKTNAESQTNHIVRADDDIKGILNIEVLEEGGFNIILHQGTSDEATSVEGIDKDRLLELIEQKL